MRGLFEITAEKLLSEQVSPALITACEDGHWPTGLWSAIEAAGLGIALAAEAHGGVGASWSDAIAIALVAGARAAPVPLCETLLANWALSQVGLDVLEGPLTVADRHDLDCIDGRATGVAQAVPWGRSAPHLVAMIAGETPRLLVLATDQASIEAGLNTAREPRDDLHFDAVPVVALADLPQHVSPASLRLGGALLRAAQIAGGLGQLIDLSVAYANERVQFGRSIGKFQAIQHQLAVLAAQGALAHAAADRAFARVDDGLNMFDVAIAKICTGEAAGAGAAIAHAVHGAIGFTYEHALHLTTRRLWSWRDEFGSEASWADGLGRDACAAKGDGLWPAITRGGFGG